MNFGDIVVAQQTLATLITSYIDVLAASESPEIADFSRSIGRLPQTAATGCGFTQWSCFLEVAMKEVVRG
ncbi:MAG: hypothetical protein FD138_4722 [Planctomycetota bacterium]|nr:MAG: hypothetical protein FD138_4722 [Planctomycetota bacterium]